MAEFICLDRFEGEINRTSGSWWLKVQCFGLVLPKDEFSTAPAVDYADERWWAVSHGRVVPIAVHVVPAEWVRLAIQHDEERTCMQVDAAEYVGHFEQQALLHLMLWGGGFQDAERSGRVEDEEAIVGGDQSLDRLFHLDGARERRFSGCTAHRCLGEHVDGGINSAVDERFVWGERDEFVSERHRVNIAECSVEVFESVRRLTSRIAEEPGMQRCVESSVLSSVWIKTVTLDWDKFS